MVILQNRLNLLLPRSHVSSSSSHERPRLAAPSRLCCCRTRLRIDVYRCNNSSNSKKGRLLLPECCRVFRAYPTDIVTVSPSERCTEIAEESACRNIADIAALSGTIQSFSTSCEYLVEKGCIASSGMKHLANEVTLAEKTLDVKVKEEDDEEDKQIEHLRSSSPLESDACSVFSEDEMQIIQAERLRRKRISEANKNRIPWNKGKGKSNNNSHKEGMHSNSAATNTYTKLKAIENDVELLIKEKQRRQRIVASNIGKVAWNKGRKISEETRQLIKERTLEAMKSPTIRNKLRLRSTKKSDETKSKIKGTMQRRWQERKKLKFMQETCIAEWKEYVADSARRGFNHDVVYCWDSYDTILKKLQDAWRLKKKSGCNETRLPRSSAHRIKSSTAIRTKQSDINYQHSLRAASCALRVKQGSAQGEMKETRRRKKSRSTTGDIIVTESNRTDQASNSEIKIGSGIWQPIHKGLASCKDSLRSEMLERLKQIREERWLKVEIERRVLERARILMEKAQTAASALKAQAATDENALVSLQDVQQLLSEAEESLKEAGLESDLWIKISGSKG